MFVPITYCLERPAACLENRRPEWKGSAFPKQTLNLELTWSVWQEARGSVVAPEFCKQNHPVKYGNHWHHYKPTTCCVNDIFFVPWRAFLITLLSFCGLVWITEVWSDQGGVTKLSCNMRRANLILRAWCRRRFSCCCCCVGGGGAELKTFCWANAWAYCCLQNNTDRDQAINRYLKKYTHVGSIIYHHLQEL